MSFHSLVVIVFVVVGGVAGGPFASAIKVRNLVSAWSRQVRNVAILLGTGLGELTRLVSSCVSSVVGGFLCSSLASTKALFLL